jgi:hypothetical protein
MSDTTPSPQDPDATPTQAVPVAEQPPAEAAVPPAPPAPAAAPRAGGSHTRTILEVIGGVVAAGLIVVAGAVGFAVGHATADDDGRWSMTRSGDGWQQGPDAGGPRGDRSFSDRGRGGDKGPGWHRGYPDGQPPAPQDDPEASTSTFTG